MVGTPKVHVYPGENGRWYWSLVGRNGEVQCPSQGYVNRPGALAGFRAAKRNMAMAVVVIKDKAPSIR
jgi:uncharacterized protein YegP (UPF0339 family)